MGAMYTKDEILTMAKKEKVAYVRLQFTDILGVIKAAEISVHELPDALDNKIMFDGSSVEGFARIKEADMYLHPDLSTWNILSFEDSSHGKIAMLICDVYNADGEPFKGDPRYILKRQIAALKEEGIENLNVGFEPEFFLFKLGPDGEPTMTLADRGGYFDLSPLDGAEYVRRDIALELEKLGFYVEKAHHEVAPGQEEISFRFDTVLEACDRVQLFKQTVKCVAHNKGYLATFMPKPIAGINGSGMHTNCSLSDKSGKNLFYDPEDPMSLSLLCRKWMTGILHHARAMAAVTNPIVNSYKRLLPGYEAPCYICWSDANRSSMIRIPAIRGRATRTEVRNVDPTANPYLALAVILGAGLDGIKHVKEDELIGPVYDNIFELTRDEREEKGIMNLPENLKDALKAFRKDDLMKDILGEHAFDKYVCAKTKEWDAFRMLVTDWELKRYLDL